MLDGNRNKLEDAKQRLVTNISEKVFIHKLFINPTPASIGLRNCGNGTTGCPVEIQQTVRSDNGNGNFRIRIHYDLIDNSNWIPNSTIVLVYK